MKDYILSRESYIVSGESVKKPWVLVIASLSVIVIYNILFSLDFWPKTSFNMMIGVGVTITVAFFLLACGVASYFPHSRRYISRKRKRILTERDSTKYRRVVRDGVDGSEVLVFGSENTTFRDACIASWQFESANRNSNWLVKDDRGNDITNSLLSSFGGIAVLIGDYGTQSHRESLDTSAEYSDLRDSVEYFDD